MEVLHKISHTLGGHVTSAYDVEGGNKTVDNIDGLFALPASRRVNSPITVRYYDEAATDAVSGGVVKTLAYNLTDYTDAKWQDLTNYTSLDFKNSDVVAYQSNTKSELDTLVGSSSLVVGKFYLLTDYATVYKPEPTAADATAPVEPLLLLAVTGNRFSGTAFSTVYPNDDIRYDFTANRINFRRINGTSTIEAGYDIRGVKTRRYKADFPAYDSGTGYLLNRIVNHSGTLYVSKATANLGNNKYDDEFWLNVSTIPVESYIVPESGMFTTIPDTGEYNDYYTIDDMTSPYSDASHFDTLIENGTILKGNFDQPSNVVFVNGSNAIKCCFSYSKNITILEYGDGAALDIKNSDGVTFIGGGKIVSVCNITESIFVDCSTTTILGSNNSLLMFGALTGTTLTSVQGYVYGLNEISNCDLDHMKNISFKSRLTQVRGSNWTNLTIPYNKPFTRVVFTIPQWLGQNTWTASYAEYKNGTIQSYYTDDMYSPTVEKLWLTETNVVGNTSQTEIE